MKESYRDCCRLSFKGISQFKVGVLKAHPFRFILMRSISKRLLSKKKVALFEVSLC
jgi:hypothetical protein